MSIDTRNKDRIHCIVKEGAKWDYILVSLFIFTVDTDAYNSTNTKTIEAIDLSLLKFSYIN